MKFILSVLIAATLIGSTAMAVPAIGAKAVQDGGGVVMLHGRAGAYAFYGFHTVCSVQPSSRNSSARRCASSIEKNSSSWGGSIVVPASMVCA